MNEKKIVRDHYGHGTGTRRVVIHRNGVIEYYGSTDDYDRSHDYWHYGGTVQQIMREYNLYANTESRQ